MHLPCSLHCSFEQLKTRLQVLLVCLPALSLAACHDDGDTPSVPSLSGRVIAVGITGAGAVAAVSNFHAGGPIHDKAEFAAYTTAGKILDPDRILVASSKNFGAPAASGSELQGAILSIDASGEPITIPGDFASAGGQVATPDGRVQLFTAQSPPFRNGVNTAGAVTAAMTSVNLPLGISINNAFGRPWFANYTGPTALSTVSVVDPTGIPLAGAPSVTAGGIFAGTLTNRSPQIVPGALNGGAIATSFVGKSPDGSGRAVFMVLNADGSVVQVHVAKGMDGLAPAGTIIAVTPDDGSTATGTAGRAGMIFNWIPDRILYVTDPRADAIVAITLSSDDTLFSVAKTERFTAAALDVPVDLAPAIGEVASGDFSSNTTLAGAADFYVANRGNGTVVRMSQAGQVIAIRTISVNGEVIGGGRLNGIATSFDAQKIYVTLSDSAPGYPGAPGALLELPAFGATTTMASALTAAPGETLEARGSRLFATSFDPEHGLGPLYNRPSCVACHAQPTVGGQGDAGLAVVSFIGRVSPAGGDPVIRAGEMLARAHSIAELGVRCALQAGVPADANLVSTRNAPDLYLAGLIDRIPDAAILAKAQAVQPDGVHGRPHLLPSAAGNRVGRFGWKANAATLPEVVGRALRNEIGLTNPLAPADIGYGERGCGVSAATLDDDGQAAMALTAYVGSLTPVPQRAAPRHGAELFTKLGCNTCHLPSFALGGTGSATLPLYSDLLLHDMGPSLDDGYLQDAARGRDWRTTPLWGLGARQRFLHDGRATTMAMAITSHGGEAQIAAGRYLALAAGERQALLDFLATL